MGKKVMYAVGDSFTFGDELLDSIKDTNSLLRKTGYKKFSLGSLNQIQERDPSLHSEIIKLKNSMTYGGALSEHYGYEFVNYAQSGSSIESILLQVWFAMADMKERGLKYSDCYVLVGLTAPPRKQLIDSNFMRPEHSREMNVRSFSGSIMIAQPEFSIRYSKPLAVEMGKWYDTDQLILEYSQTVMNIELTLAAAGIRHNIINVWNHGVLDGIKNPIIREMTSMTWTEFDLFGKVIPKYPTSLVMQIDPQVYLSNLVSTPMGHPNAVIHRMWADSLINDYHLDV